ncbi:MAG: zinc-ribbon domain-containing protein [Acidimicrobiales bacterium]
MDFCRNQAVSGGSGSPGASFTVPTTAYVFSRARDDRGCPQCSGRVVWPGVNDLVTLYPEVAAELVDADPRTIHAGTKKKCRWRCIDGHEWEAGVSTRTRKLATGCPVCASSGFDPSKPAWLYLLRHQEAGLLQIGITNSPQSRLATHQRGGWTLLDQVPVDGSAARAMEREILDTVRAAGAKQPRQRFDGYTESWSSVAYPTASLAELVVPAAASPVTDQR